MPGSAATADARCIDSFPDHNEEPPCANPPCLEEPSSAARSQSRSAAPRRCSRHARPTPIPTVNAGGGFSYSPGTVSNAFIDQYTLGEMVAQHFATDLGGKGKVFAMLPIAGTTAAVDQLAALNDVLKKHPGIELLSAEHGD